MANGHGEQANKGGKQNKVPQIARPKQASTVPITDIYFNREWNGREASRYEVADDKLGNMKDFSAGMASEGQRTPIDVRPNLWKSKEHPEPYAAVTGFRRGEGVRLAVLALATENEGKTGADRRAPRNNVELGIIDAFVHEDMTEEQAVILNAVENLDRLDLEPTDQAFSVWRVTQAMRKVKPDISGADIGKTLGLSATHVNMLNKIQETVCDDVCAAWRAVNPRHALNPNAVALSLANMQEIGAIGKDKPAEQIAKFQVLCATGGKKGGAGRGNWLESAKGRAGEIGAMLGTLQRLGHIDAAEILWSEALFGEKPGDASPVGEKWHKDVNEASETGGLTAKATESRAEIVAAALDAFAKAVHVQTEEEKKADAAKAAEAAANGTRGTAPAAAAAPAAS
jgi:hypothetical protein